MQSDEGYDARLGQYVDMMKAGIIDPTKVRIVAMLFILLLGFGV